MLIFIKLSFKYFKIIFSYKIFITSYLLHCCTQFAQFYYWKKLIKYDKFFKFYALNYFFQLTCAILLIFTTVCYLSLFVCMNLVYCFLFLIVLPDGKIIMFHITLEPVFNSVPYNPQQTSLQLNQSMTFISFCATFH